MSSCSVSLKLAFFLHQSAKVNHFQFWMLSSIEWRLNDLAKKVNAMEKSMAVMVATSKREEIEDEK